MYCKVFSSSGGWLNQGIGEKPILLEDAINKFLNEQPIKILNVIQSQSSCGVSYIYINTTTTIFYETNNSAIFSDKD